METPNKMIGGIAGTMAQQPGVLGGTTNLGAPVQTNQMPQSLINPTALGGMQPQMPNIFGQPQPGVSYNNLMPQAGATGPLNQNIDPSTARNMVSAAGNVNPMREAAKIAGDVNELKNKDNPDAFTEKIINAKIKQGKAIYNSLTQEGKDISNEYLTGKRKLIK
jgi:hypothetical protein